MIVHQEVKKLPRSSVALTLTVAKEASRQEYESLLKRYSQNVVLPGFRKGKVPSSILELKFGEGLKIEAMQEVIDKALHEAFEKVEEKPLSYSQPAIVDKELKLELEKDFTFTLQYDVYPGIKLGDYKGVEIEVPQVVVTADDEARELEKLRDQNAMVVDKATGSIARGDTVTVDYVEVDAAGEPIEITRRADFVFTVGTGLNYYKFDDELVGLSKGEEKNITKNYPKDFEQQDLAGSSKTLLVKVTAVKEKKLPDLDDDFAQDVSEKYQSLSDLKSAIHDRLNKNLETQLKNRNVEALLDKIAVASVFELPESMLQAEMEQTWRSFASQSRMDPSQLENILGQEGKRKLFEDWRPQSESALRRRLVMEKIIELESITASETEIQTEIENQAQLNHMGIDEAREYFEKNGLVDYLVHELKDRKLGDFLLANAKVKKGKKLSYLDLTERKE